MERCNSIDEKTHAKSLVNEMIEEKINRRKPRKLRSKITRKKANMKRQHQAQRVARARGQKLSSGLKGCQIEGVSGQSKNQYQNAKAQP